MADSLDSIVPPKPQAPQAAPDSLDSITGSKAAVAPAPAAGPAPSPLRGLQRAGQSAGKVAGKALVAGHKDPFGSFLNVVTGPQRGLQSLEMSASQGHINTPEAWRQAVSDVMHPARGKALTQGTKQLSGLADLEAGPLAGDDLPHKLERGGLDYLQDAFNDPVAALPVGKLGELAGKGIKAIPGAARLGEAIATGPGRIFNADHYLRGLTPQAKAAFELATNRSMEAVRQRQIAEDAIVARNAAAIRAGKMPDEVARLFQLDPTGKTKQITGPGDAWKQYFLDKETGKVKFGPGTRPQDVTAALYRHRAPMFQHGVEQQIGGVLKNHPGNFTSDTSTFAVKPGMSDVDRQAAIAATQARLKKVVEHKPDPADDRSLFKKGAEFLTRRGNQAFLSNPVPHTLNLSNLAYNRYGLLPTIQGLGNAARVATGKTGGKLGQDIGELEGMGAKSQYGNLYDEMGLTRLLGIPGTEGAARLANKAIIPAERFANAAQHKILNSTETGLRAAALNAEKRAGNTGAQAAKNIHAAFGTDAPNAIVSSAQHNLAAPFAKFHLQTAPGSGLRTLAAHPSRVINPVKAQRDINAQVNPHGPQWDFSLPAMSTAKLLTDPEGYVLGHLGPLTTLQSPYGLMTNLQKGKVLKILGDTGAQYTPGSQQLGPTLDALKALRSKKPADRKKALQEIGPAIFGGYNKK